MKKVNQEEKMRRIKLLVLASAAALVSTGAFAALENSHHDLTVYSSAGQLCFQCHGLTDNNPSAASDVGTVGGLCVGRCHSGAGILSSSATLVPTPNFYPTYTDAATATQAASKTPDASAVYIGALTGAHKADPTELVGTDLSTALNTVAGTGWPYASNTTAMECSTCHSVHDNTNTPFLWDDLYDTTGASLDKSFCVNCHTGAASRNTNDLSAAPDGNHPVEFEVSTATASTTRAAVSRLGRQISIDQAAPGKYFDVVSTNGTALNGTGTDYTLGGKLSTFDTWTDAGDGTEHMSCFTCHAVHTTDPFGQLIVAPYAADASGSFGQNAICMGCHGGGATVAANYAYDFTANGNVGVTDFGHNVNGMATNTGTALSYLGTGNIPITIANPTLLTNTELQAPQLGTQGEVVCASCHDIHGGMTDTAIIWSSFPAADICTACHNGAGLADVQDVSEGGAGEVQNSHHRTAAAPADFSTSATGSNDADTLTMSNPSWGADLSDGLQCSDCHVSNGTAHNW